MNKLLTLIIPAATFILMSCATAKVDNENWEGFSGDVMRIIISEYFPPDENDIQKIPQNLINERTWQRASLMLASYINLKIPRNYVNQESDRLFNRLIAEAIAGGKTLSSSCDENNHCHVVMEYNIAAINMELGKMK